MSAAPLAPAPLPPFVHEASAESAGRWLGARAGALVAPPRIGDRLPLAYCCFLRVQPATGLSIHRALGRDPDRGLFGGVCLSGGGLRVGDSVRVGFALEDRRTTASPRGDVTMSTLRAIWRGAGALVDEAVRMIDLPPGPAQPPPPPVHETPAAPLLREMAPITHSQIAWMTVETGDWNPLHLDPGYARVRQFRDVVVPGPLLAALIERELESLAGAPLRRLDLRLRAASHPNERLALHGAAAGPRWRFSVYAIDTEGRHALRATGDAEAADISAGPPA